MPKDSSPWATVQKRWKGVVFDMGKREVEPMKRITSGIKSVDTILGGGFPVGRMTEMYGTESSGKTTLALHAAAEVTKQGGRVLFVDAEQSFSPEYAKNLGVVMENLYMTQENVTEKVIEMTLDFIEQGNVTLVIWDSLASLTPQSQADGEVGAPQMGRGALLLSQELKRVMPILRKHDATLLVVNQIRKSLGVVYGNPEYQPGGNAMKFYASVRMQLRARGGESGKILDGKSSIGNLVNVSVTKNKTATPGEKAVLRLVYGAGFTEEGEGA